MRNSCIILVGNPEGQGPHGRLIQGKRGKKEDVLKK
jgi:hypothetical protein